MNIQRTLTILLIASFVIIVISFFVGVPGFYQTQDIAERVRLVEEYRPDVVLMDAKMPVMDGVEATRLIKERWPEVRVVVLTIHASYRADALVASADAFLIKGCAAQKLLDPILDR